MVDEDQLDIPPICRVVVGGCTCWKLTHCHLGVHLPLRDYRSVEALSAAMVKAELSECDVRAALKEHLDSIACHYHNNIMVGSTTVNIVII